MANSTYRAATLLVLLFSTVAVSPAFASTLTAFSRPGCAGITKDVNGCGCFSIIGFQEGFHFVFTEGQSARLYYDSHCRGYSELLDTETRRCERHNFKSILMIC